MITGATENIGLALAHEYAKSGDDLLLIARDSAQLAVQKQDIEVRHNVSVYYLAASLSEIGSSAFGDRALEDSDFLKMFGRRSPPTVARITECAYMAGLQVIIPGGINFFNFLMLRLSPSFLSRPIMGWLLKRRDDDSTV